MSQELVKNLRWNQTCAIKTRSRTFLKLARAFQYFTFESSTSFENLLATLGKKLNCEISFSFWKPSTVQLNFLPLSVIPLVSDRVFVTSGQNSTVLSSKLHDTRERLITVNRVLVEPFVFQGHAWKIQFSRHVLRYQLEAPWDVWSCESYSRGILFVHRPFWWKGAQVCETIFHRKLNVDKFFEI